VTGEARSRASNRGPGDVQGELLEPRDRIEDRVRKFYEKLGVGSRLELVAPVFLDGVPSEVVRHTPLTSRGRFNRE
jgi:hypothetical protein